MVRLVRPVAASDVLRILLIEDQAVDQILIRRGLDSSGLSVELEAVRSASAAVKKLMATKERWHLVMLDLQLKETDGLEFLQALKEHEEWRTIPVVVLSGTLDPERIQRAYGLGAAAVLEKPRNVYELQDVVRRVAGVWGQAARQS